MIVNVRIDVTDEQRRALSRCLFPDSPARMSTRKEFNEWVNCHVADLTRPVVEEQRPVLSDDGPVQLSPELSSEAVQSVQDSNLSNNNEQDENVNSTRFTPLLLSITNAMHSIANATMIAKQLSPILATRFKACRATVVDLRYEIADKHDAELESKLEY